MTTEPEVTCPGAGTAFSSVSASVDLPDPDSPTRPVIWPRARSSDTPATAGSGPSGVGNDTVRLRTRTAADASARRAVRPVFLRPRRPGQRRLASVPSHQIRLSLGLKNSSTAFASVTSARVISRMQMSGDSR